MLRSAAAAVLFGLLFLPQAATAHEVKAKGLQMEHPWIRAAGKGVAVTAGYVEITNTGKTADRLVGATLKGAAKGEIHETAIEDGVARMRPVTAGIEIGAGQTVALKPNGLHLMFTGLTTTMDEDSYVDGTLLFEKGGTVEVEFFVEAPAKPKSQHEHAH